MKEALRAWRKEMNLSQLALSKLMGVHVSSVKNWESGRKSPDNRSRADLKRLGFDVSKYDKEQKK